MKSAVTLYRFFNYLSLDVACGAMVCAAFFAKILDVQLRPYGLASLGLTVWIIYTTDHLLDVRKLKQVASSQRHRFHQNNFRSLGMALIIAGFADLLLVLFIRRPILNWGIGLSFIVLIYLFFQQKLVFMKEFVISLLYSAGILLPAMSLTTVTLSIVEGILVASFVLTAFINLILFSCYDWKDDLMDKHSSLVTRLGRFRAQKILIVLFLVQAILLAGLILMTPYKSEALILALMNLPLMILFLFPEKFSGEENLYRLIGDMVFLFPMPYLLFVH